VAGEEAIDRLVIAAAHAVEEDHRRLAVGDDLTGGWHGDRRTVGGWPGWISWHGRISGIATGGGHAVPSLPQSYQRVARSSAGVEGGIF
jgi:hypothetical protein